MEDDRALVVGGREEHAGDVFTDIGVSRRHGRWVVTYPSNRHRIIAVGRSQWTPKATQRPNQAMQRTAPRSVFPPGVATTVISKPRALSGAVADLVSR
jgi:hypothetical protein